MNNGIFQWWISSEVELMSVMLGFPSFTTKILCRAVNRLVSDIINYWSRATPTAANNVFDLCKPLLNVLRVIACRWIIRIVKILMNDTVEPEEITNIEMCMSCTVQLVLELCTVATDIGVQQSDWWRAGIRWTNLHTVEHCNKIR